MVTENRWNERQTADHKVLIKARPHGLQPAHIRDVSSSGLFVELPPTALLAEHTRVDLIFVRSANQVSRILRIPALVVRATPTGAGLMFLDSSLMAFRTMLTQLLAEKKQAAQPSRATLDQVRPDVMQHPANAMAHATHESDTGSS